jgi:carboxylesterase type B
MYHFQSDTSLRLPVMVFIYGGGFTSGDNSAVQYGPFYFLDKDVVLVTINYRLGVLGE